MMPRTTRWATVVASALFVASCSSDDRSAGGSSYETENPLIAQVLDSLGLPQAGCSVRIRPYWFVGAGSIMPTDSSQGIWNTATDTAGRFQVGPLPAGEYRVEVLGGSKGLLAPLTIHKEQTDEGVRRFIVQEYGQLQGNVGILGASAARIQVYGTEHMAVAGLSGGFNFRQFPAGPARIRATSNTSGKVLGEIAISVLARTTSAISTLIAGSEDLRTWRHVLPITLNTSSSGVPVSQDVYDFPLVLRLDSAALRDASTDGGDLRIVDPSGLAIPYEIESWDSLRRTALVWTRLDTVHANVSAQRLLIYVGNPGARSKSDPVATWDTGAGWAGVWHLTSTYRDASGRSRATDVTANRMDGVFGGRNKDLSVSGVFPGHAFDGSTDVFRIGGGTSQLGSSDFTLDAWIDPSRSGTLIFHKGNNDLSSGTKLAFLGASSGSNEVHGYPSLTPWLPGWTPTYRVGIGSTDYAACTHDAAIPILTWVHLALRWTSTAVDSGRAEWFVNGVRSTASGTLPKISDRSGDSLGIGDAIPGLPDSLRFSGIMGQFRLSRIARSDAWIWLSVESQRPRTPLVKYP